MRTALIIIGLIILIAVGGYVERGWIDFYGTGALALLLIPTIIALRGE